MLIQSGCRQLKSMPAESLGILTQESVDSMPGEEPQSPESGEVEDEEATPVTLQFGAAARAALAGLDRVDLEAEFTTRACVMESPPAFVKSLQGMRFALVEADRAPAARDDLAATRVWKLFLLLPRLLLHKPPRGGQIPKSRLIERFSDLARGR